LAGSFHAMQKTGAQADLISDPGFGLDVGVLEMVIETGTAEERRKLSLELAELTADENTPEAERAQVVPVILKLVGDADKDVRRSLAEALSATPLAHADIVFSIAADDDDIALPFLAATPSLDGWKMLAIMRVGDLARQAAIAGRADVTAETVADCVHARELRTCVALLDNPAVAFTPAQYQTLYKRFGQAPEMLERLLARADLPLDIRVTQAKRASNRIHQLMAERGWIPANDAAALVVDAEETAVLRILVNASIEEMERVIAFLTSKNMLTPSIILRAACLGEMEVVERSLAHLARMPVGRARQMIYAQGGLSFRSLVSKSGLPTGCTGILRAAADVARDVKEEGLVIDAGAFGRRLIEALMTRYESISTPERTKLLDFIGRLAEDKVRVIAKRLRADLMRAA
jgi:uncharacterized protein (DUF2336 family)